MLCELLAARMIRQRVGTMNKPSIKSITLKNLIRFFLLFTILLSVSLAVNFRSFAEDTVKNKAYAIAEMIKAGLTSHMKAGIMDKRDYFLQEIASTYEVDSIRVIRSDAVVNQFGEGHQALERRVEDDTRIVFEKKEPLFVWDDISKEVKIRAVIPYIASTEGRLNCLGCHNVEEGTVLGAIDMTIDATPYRNSTMGYVLIIMIVVMLFSLLIITNMFKVVDQHVKKPLCDLIRQARETYERHTTIDTDAYESSEFEGVAKNINEFNEDILRNQDELAAKNIELCLLNEEIEETLKETLFTMGKIEEFRSNETKNHTVRVVKLSKLMAEKAGLSEEDIKLITIASPIHDIGKIGIPDSILNKPAKLTEAEFGMMKAHTLMGHSMLKHSRRDILQAGMRIAYEHHEKWDGSGYPQGLRGEEIHIYARIVALVDVFDALAAKRCYKEPWPRTKIVRYMREQSGVHFDPDLISIFLDDLDDFYAILEAYSDTKQC